MPIELRHRTFFAYLDVPKDVRRRLRRRVFRQTLQTDSRSVAERRAAPLIAQWKSEIAAKRDEPNHDDAKFWPDTSPATPTNLRPGSPRITPVGSVTSLRFRCRTSMVRLTRSPTRLTRSRPMASRSGRAMATSGWAIPFSRRFSRSSIGAMRWFIAIRRSPHASKICCPAFPRRRSNMVPTPRAPSCAWFTAARRSNFRICG